MKKTIKLIFLILITFQAFQGFAESDDERRNELIKITDEQFKEIVRLDRQTGSRKSVYQIRLAELLSEKAVLVKERENARYLNLSASRRTKVKKSSYFRESNALFKKSYNIYKKVTRRFKKFKGKGEVYLSLAKLARELNREREVERYLKNSLRYSQGNSKINIQASRVLAEIQYNKKRYSKAIPLYLKVLKRSRDYKWWPRDAYNLAWCYYRQRSFKNAVDWLESAYRLKGNEKYVDVFREMERDLAYFYISQGQTNKAVSFLEEIGGDLDANFLRLGKYVLKQGNFSVARTVFEKAQQITEDSDIYKDAVINLVELYEKFGLYSKHLKACKSLRKYFNSNDLDEEQREIYKYQVQKVLSTLQKQVIGKRYASKGQRKTRGRKLRQVLEYFKLRSELKIVEGYENDFHIAETYYAVGNYNNSIEYYYKSYKGSKKGQKKGAKIRRSALNGLLASLAEPKLGKTAKNKYLQFGYKTYIEYYPRGRKSVKIHQRLFSLYYRKKEMGKAEEVLLSFRRNYPRHLKTQEAMLAQIMDHYRKVGNRAVIKQWIKRIERGEFKVSKKYGAKLRSYLMNLQFENVEKLNNSGDKSGALMAYLDIFREKGNSRAVKKNAAYNIALLFYELRDLEKTFNWLKIALSLMSNSDVKRFESSFLVIAAEFFNRRMTVEATYVYETVLTKVCKLRSNNKEILFKNAHVLHFAEGNIHKGKKIIDLGKKCKVSRNSIDKSRMELLKLYNEKEYWNNYAVLLNQLSRKSSAWPVLIEHYGNLSNAYGIGKKRKATNKKILKLYSSSLKKGYKIPLESLNVVASIKMKELEREVKKFERIRLNFPEKTFNLRLQQKFAQLDKVTTKAIEILKIGSGEGIVKGYKYLIESYRDLIRAIENFSPPGKSKKYVSSFKQGMKTLIVPIKKRSNKFLQEARVQIEKNKILSKLNSFFLKGTEKQLPIEYNYLPSGIIMDRGGRK